MNAPITPPRPEERGTKLPEKPKPRDTPFPAPGQPPTPKQKSELEDGKEEEHPREL
ncbi:hypothetical protein [Phyllobacterium zundukense]|jgi:hypothetical protein|uniref:Uncharacterized protein n=1 Tax=Phyllobacterium zundukense TaxID=1867719 RepID=A0ACD4D960_9HYPH|nr:hypothetical protein [Phyllobacterium zundukense]UXN62339.1 hypothetical protein N8E88_20360 [Phyllobacterium zundukense]